MLQSQCRRSNSGFIMAEFMSQRVALMQQFDRYDKSQVSRILSISSSVFLRLALGVSFLSAVADRFGLWGAVGQPHLAWGRFARFAAYTGQLNWFLPKATILGLAIAVTFAETLVGI